MWFSKVFPSFSGFFFLQFRLIPTISIDRCMTPSSALYGIFPRHGSLDVPLRACASPGSRYTEDSHTLAFSGAAGIRQGTDLLDFVL